MATIKSSFEAFAKQYFGQTISIAKGLDDKWRAYAGNNPGQGLLCELPGDIEAAVFHRGTLGDLMEHWTGLIDLALGRPKSKARELSDSELLDLHERVCAIRPRGHQTYEATRAEVLSRMSERGLT